MSPHWMVPLALGVSVAAFSIAGELPGAGATAADRRAGPAPVETSGSRPDTAIENWGVQVAGSFSLQQAESMFERVREAIPDVLRDREPSIIMSPLGNRGPRGLYRIRIQFMSRSLATMLCDTIREHGQSCIVLPSSR
jgi:hypothetical protein